MYDIYTAVPRVQEIPAPIPAARRKEKDKKDGHRKMCAVKSLRDGAHVRIVPCGATRGPYPSDSGCGIRARSSESVC